MKQETDKMGKKNLTDRTLAGVGSGNALAVRTEDRQTAAAPSRALCDLMESPTSPLLGQHCRPRLSALLIFPCVPLLFLVPTLTGEMLSRRKGALGRKFTFPQPPPFNDFHCRNTSNP